MPSDAGTPGAIFAKYPSSRRSDGLFRTKNRIDSGKTAAVTTAISNGISPPTTNTDCHPKRDIRPAATKPPNAAPIVKPHNIVVTAVLRYLWGVNSKVNEMVFG